MATFLLVHGAMHGGWCWRTVRDILTARGHRVLTPSLTGQGERSGHLSPSVGVATHVDDLADLLWYEDLQDVHLVLHSYSGILAGPVAERARGRLSSVVWLGGFVVGPGQCLLDVEPPEVARRYRERVAEAGDGWYLPADPAFLSQWGVHDEALRAWAGPRLTAFPFRCQTDPVRFDPAPLAALPRFYVRHTSPSLPSLDLSAATALAQGCAVRTLATGHDMMLVAPDATARLLLDIARQVT
ncbi:alpha/beta hydrolase [Streptomyces sp. SP18ES09]|uniref:alpha/beta fold hydrolase n=1 Tax=Streptomyces sp. SP18ES09 TaxID=3002532 RepID=UPI002E76E986|nr:alpha/beta hydrolase family protein [Streptomyces sp. SP18ES09]MEE1819559.1 alpha/beta hydrolase [Streptomyces sp. SP18ES09]